MQKRLIFGLLVGAVLTVALSGCGGSDEKQVSTSETSPAATGAAATTAATSASAAQATPSGPQVFDVKAGDYFFEPKDLTVRPGTVTVKLTNEGPERPHTFAVKKLSGDGDIVRSERVAVGQGGTVEFAASDEGTYEVYCTLPGHADRGQTGTLTVKRS